MLEALIPYITAPALTLAEKAPLVGTLELQLFGPLVAAGLLAGRWRSDAYARAKDIDFGVYRRYLIWMLVVGFVISHWVSAIFYFPHEVQKNPWILLKIWNGLSSMGGFFGAFVGAMLFLRIHCARQPMGAQPVLVFSDLSVFGLLIGWCFGRAGCSLVHDHPGKVVPEGTFLAVGPWPDGSWRYDLGLVELLFAITMTVLVYFVIRWDRWAPGRLTGLMLTTYAPFRFLLDFLRADEAAKGVLAVPDERYASMTPAQWFTIPFLVMGLWLLFVRKPSARDLSYAKQSTRPLAATPSSAASVSR